MLQFPTINSLSIARDIATFIRFGDSQETWTARWIGASKAHDDEPIFFTLIAIYGVNFYQLFEAFIPKFLIEFLPYYPFLFGIHANDSDECIVSFFEFIQVTKKLTAK